MLSSLTVVGEEVKREFTSTVAVRPASISFCEASGLSSVYRPVSWGL